MSHCLSPPPSPPQGMLSNILIRPNVELDRVWPSCEVKEAWPPLLSSLLNPHPLTMCLTPQGLLCAPFLFIFILTKGLINNWRLVDKGGNSWLHFKRRLSDRFGKLFRIQKHKALMVEWLSEELVVWGIRQSQIILQRWLLIPKGSMFSQAGITMSYDFLRGTRPLWLLTSFSLSRKRIGLDFL